MVDRRIFARALSEQECGWLQRIPHCRWRRQVFGMVTFLGSGFLWTSFWRLFYISFGINFYFGHNCLVYSASLWVLTTPTILVQMPGAKCLPRFRKPQNTTHTVRRTVAVLMNSYQDLASWHVLNLSHMGGVQMQQLLRINLFFTRMVYESAWVTRNTSYKNPVPKYNSVVKTLQERERGKGLTVGESTAE